MSVVAITWIPIKKDAESSPAAKALGGLKEKFLAKADLEHAYNGKSVDPNEPPSIELFDGKNLSIHSPLEALLDIQFLTGTA